MNTTAERALHVCPKCSTANKTEDLIGRDYRCSKCGVELAHVDVTGSGVVRGIFGWLRSVGEIVSDRYRIKSVLGKGGFGVTYLVEDLRLNGKRRALKEVPELLFDEQETLLLSRLSHPAIPDIIDRSISNNMVYFVLEFGGNRTLNDERRRLNGRIPFPTLLPWMRQLSEVLAYLHSQNPPVIHRDLKPDNVLINEDNRIMLIDFGIAKEGQPDTVTRTLGRAITHGFSPPEQMLGTGTDPRSDIYSFAATFYALVTGVTPTGAHERISGKALTAPSALAPDLPASVDQALVRALNLNANQRQQYVSELLHVLTDLERTQPRTDDATVLLTPTNGTVEIAELPAPAHASPQNIAKPKAMTRNRSLGLAAGLLLCVFIMIGVYYKPWESSTLRSVATEPYASPQGDVLPAQTSEAPLSTATRVPAPDLSATASPNKEERITSTHEPSKSNTQLAPTSIPVDALQYEPTQSAGPSAPSGRASTGSRLAYKPLAIKRRSAAIPTTSPAPPEPDWSGSMSRGDVHRAD